MSDIRIPQNPGIGGLQEFTSLETTFLQDLVMAGGFSLQEVTDIGSTTTNSIEAQSFITTGGTSSDFVKGDGSLDSNTYLTAETDTLASVTGRGATTATQSTFSGGLLSGLGTALLPSYSFTGDTNTGLWSPTADTFAWSTGGSERMRVDSSGNVGIGTTAPNEKLSVESSIESIARFSSTNAVSRILINSTTASPNAGINLLENNVTKWALATYAGGKFTFFNASTNAEALGIDASSNVVFNETGRDSDFRIESDINTHAFFLEGSTGNVGIGTASPASLLHVNGAVRISQDVIMSSRGRFGWGTTGTDMRVYAVNDLELGSNNSYSGQLVVKASGNVGIGTTAPSAKAHIIGTTEQLRVGYDASNYFNAIVGSTGTTTFNAVGTGAKFVFSDNIELTQTVTTEVVVSDTTVTIVINGTTYKLLAKA